MAAIQGTCPMCGKNRALQMTSIAGKVVRICVSCREAIREKAERERAVQK